MSLVEGQISIFDYLEQKENTGCEIILYESGVVGVIANFEPKEIIPQGDITKKFKPKWNKQTYFINKDGEIKAIGIGARRYGKPIKIEF